jgi:hypothetical protein
MTSQISRQLWTLSLALLLACSGQSAAEDTMPSPQNPIGEVYLKGSDGWHSLGSLIDASWQYLTSKASVPPAARRAVVVSINRESTNELARITFGGGVGKQFWEVRVGLDGKVRDWISGSIGDLHRSSPPEEK